MTGKKINTYSETRGNKTIIVTIIETVQSLLPGTTGRNTRPQRPTRRDTEPEADTGAAQTAQEPAPMNDEEPSRLKHALIVWAFVLFIVACCGLAAWSTIATSPMGKSLGF